MRSPLLAHHSWLVVITFLGGGESFSITRGSERRYGTANARNSRRNIDLQSSAGTGDASDGASSPSWYHFTERDCGVDEIDSFTSKCDAVVATLDAGNDEMHDMWVRPCHDLPHSDIEERGLAHQRTDEQHAIASVTKEAIDAIDATHRWSSNFVRGLQLCPWAGASLDTPGAVRYWVLVVEDSGSDIIDLEQRWVADLGEMESLVRRAGRQLKRITSPSMTEEGADPIDPSVAISFVVLVDKQSGRLPDFGTFHEFFLELEDRLLDECDDYWDSLDDGENGDDVPEDGDAENVPLGCDITIAAFHPQWQFGDGGDNAKNDQAIDYEKRTPYPTISIVKSSAIDALMSQDGNGDADVEHGLDGALNASSAPATERIAANNQQTLEGFGVKRLKEMFETEVVRCPLDHGGLT